MFEAEESHEQIGPFEKVTVTRLQGTDWREVTVDPGRPWEMTLDFQQGDHRDLNQRSTVQVGRRGEI